MIMKTIHKRMKLLLTNKIIRLKVIKRKKQKQISFSKTMMIRILLIIITIKKTNKLCLKGLWEIRDKYLFLKNKKNKN